MTLRARSNELLRYGFKPSIGRDVEGGAPILRLKIDVTARSKEPLCDGRMTLRAAAKWSGVNPSL
jgi:hypothetical protein